MHISRELRGDVNANGAIEWLVSFFMVHIISQSLSTFMCIRYDRWQFAGQLNRECREFDK